MEYIHNGLKNLGMRCYVNGTLCTDDEGAERLTLVWHVIEEGHWLSLSFASLHEIYQQLSSTCQRQAALTLEQYLVATNLPFAFSSKNLDLCHILQISTFMVCLPYLWFVRGDVGSHLFWQTFPHPVLSQPCFVSGRAGCAPAANVTYTNKRVATVCFNLMIYK